MDGFNENIIRKVMPHDDDAERAVLTSMLMSSKAIQEVQEVIKAGDEFYNKVYGTIFETITEMENSGQKVDPVTLKDKLSEKGLPSEVASLSFIMEIMKDSSSSTRSRTCGRFSALCSYSPPPFASTAHNVVIGHIAWPCLPKLTEW